MSALASSADPKPKPTSELFRAPDDRPLISKEQVKALGIHVYESQRLRLFTDIEPEIATSLPPLVDQMFQAWEDYFGKLPGDADDREFQVNGYLIKDKTRFEKAGLLRKDLPDKFHGQQIGYQFWMMDQDRDYYRRHLLLHEATHAFMLAFPNQQLPPAYLEGMAEYIGTHRLVDGKLTPAVMPHNRDDFRGHDRLFLLRRDVGVRTKDQRALPNVRDLGNWNSATFKFFDESYAWAWGMCVFLDNHPRTRDRFRELARSLNDPQAWPKFLKKLEPDESEITTEWNLFAAEAYESFDFARMAIEFQEGRPISELTKQGLKPHRIDIAADRGWQPTGILVEKGRSYDVNATGKFTLADKLDERDKPWVSEADGITFRYHAGRPLGKLLATIRPASESQPSSNESAPDELEPMFAVVPLGTKARLTAERSGTLYLRLNDHPGELKDNRGRVAVEIRERSADD